MAGSWSRARRTLSRFALPEVDKPRTTSTAALESLRICTIRSPMDLPPLPRNTPLAPRSRCNVVISWLNFWAVALAITVVFMSRSVL